MNTTEVLMVDSATRHQMMLDQMEQMKKDLEVLNAERDKNLETILKGSILYQKTKKFLDNEIQEVLVCHTFMDKFLDELEGYFDFHHELASPEIAVDYLAAASHREKQGRYNNRIQEIQKWLDK